ncbi:MAG: protein gvpI [Halobacteria archaeon]
MTDKIEQKQKRQRKKTLEKAKSNRDATRRKLIQQHRKLAEKRKRNVKKTRSRKKNTNDDENPTRRSSLPPQKTNLVNAVRNSLSNVPEKPRHSQVQPSKRLYGLKLFMDASKDKSEKRSVDECTETEEGVE